MNGLGEKIDEFEIPVCNIFVAKIWKDQVCYEMDLNLIKDENDIFYQLKDGILLILDFNEERQFEQDDLKVDVVENVRNYFHSNEDNTVRVHIDSIGKEKLKLCGD